MLSFQRQIAIPSREPPVQLDHKAIEAAATERRNRNKGIPRTENERLNQSFMEHFTLRMPPDGGKSRSKSSRPEEARKRFQDIQKLLDEGADVNQTSEDSQAHGRALTAIELEIFCEYPQTEIVRLLLSRGAEIDSKPIGGILEIASQSSWAAKFASPQELIESSVAICLCSQIQHIKNKHSSPEPVLNEIFKDHSMESRHNANLAALLLKSGADANSIGPDGSALVLAIISGRYDTVRVLLDHVGGIDLESAKGTPLVAAATTGHERIATLLLHCGAAINLESFEGTPLVAAVLKGHENMVALLLSYGADINLDSSRGTPLVAAASTGHDRIVTLLLNRGAAIDLGSMAGTPYVAAALIDHGEIVTLLLERGLDIDHESVKRTPLIAAALMDQKEIVTLLLSRGADINQSLVSRHPELTAAASGVPISEDDEWPRQTPPILASPQGFAAFFNQVWVRNTGLELPERLLECTDSVLFIHSYSSTVWDRWKSWFERYSGEEWLWYPFNPPKPSIPVGKTRMQWKCVSVQPTVFLS